MADLSQATRSGEFLAVDQPDESALQSSFWLRFCRLIVSWEWVWLLLVLPAVLFPTPTRALVLIVMPLLWLARRVATGRFVPPTPLNSTILLFLFMVLVSLYATFDVGFSLGKLAGLIHGVAVFYAVVAIGGRNLRWFYASTALFVALGTAMAALGLLTLRWSSTKIPLLEPLLPHIPRVLVSLPGATEGVSPNQLASMLLWIMPVAFVASLAPLLPGVSLAWWKRPLLALPAFLITILLGLIFILTQSRSALLGLILAAPLVALIPLWRYKAPLLALLFITSLVVFFLFSRGGSEQTAISFLDRASSRLVSSVDDTVIHLEARVIIWSHSLAAIHDFPWTGIGLGTLRYVAPRLYPFYTSDLDEEVPHAHNHLLHTALDLGVPGLVAYLSIWLGAAVLLRQVWRWGTAGGSRLFVLAFAGALMAYFIFGVADTTALGAKTGFLLWFLFGLIAAYHRTIVPAIWK
jgi:putative inorganic carbon (HCO3(-)) transporter